jgi:SAM-dependent methyltransferase
MALIPDGSKLLEIGAGAGWQALTLQRAGFQVEAIDLAESTLGVHAKFPVSAYDGHKLPFGDDSFDVIFSSNVLEHIPHIDEIHLEMHRVVKPGGLAVHILPTTAWRFWTSISHPVWVLRRVLETASYYLKNTSTSTHKVPSAHRARWRYLIWPNRHGEQGNSLTELYWFSQRAWRRQFEMNDWKIVRMEPIRLFYTGNQIYHHHIGMDTRGRLSRFLGSATCFYILQKGYSAHDRK